MDNKSRKKIVFLSGTRADFGKIKSLIKVLNQNVEFDTYIFVTGMHMLSKYGSTYLEVEKTGFKNIHKFINQNEGDSMDRILTKTISGFSDYVREVKPDFIIVHGDRLEALAGAIVGSFNNILTGHIEGGEVSGTIDEIIRHSVSKLSHVHFVANAEARKRLIQLGEDKDTIHVIGSPDIDIMNSATLPSIEDVWKRYSLKFSSYGILLFHPVTTELSEIKRHVNRLVSGLLETSFEYVVIYPNNDPGSDIILNEYERLKDNPRFKIFPSMRFEYFLTLLKNAKFIVGNSSVGVREAPHFGVPTINIGSRQNGRVICDSVYNIDIDKDSLIDGIKFTYEFKRNSYSLFGDGESAPKFIKVLKMRNFWKQITQKRFIDIN